MDISVVIPTYKKTDLLFRNLKHNLSYLDGCQTVVVNDDPEQSIKHDLNKNVPDITLVENKQNMGFGGAVNAGIAQATHRYVLLLNSDVLLQDKSYIAAVDHFASNQALFAVSFSQKEKDESVVGKNRIYWRKGFLLHEKARDLSFGINAWAEGGACLIDKQKFDNLGAFDEIYTPFYWEDIDLSYRAWKAGYEVVFDPEIQVEHHHESTIGSLFEKDMVKTTAYRNQFLFVWRNIRYLPFVLSHLFWLAPHLILMSMRGDWAFVNGFTQAVGKIASAKPMPRFEVKRGDRYVVEMV